MVSDTTLKALEDVLVALRESRERPHGPEATPNDRMVAGHACVKFAGDPDTARTLWKLIAQDCGGYFPRAAVWALVRASETTNLIPDVQAPDPS